MISLFLQSWIASLKPTSTMNGVEKNMNRKGSCVVSIEMVLYQLNCYKIMAQMPHIKWISFKTWKPTDLTIWVKKWAVSYHFILGHNTIFVSLGSSGFLRWSNPTFKGVLNSLLPPQSSSLTSLIAIILSEKNVAIWGPWPGL